MPFDYKRTKQAHSGDSFWTSYSDLFLGLSTIFLLLYVTASLRTGTDAIKSEVENKKLSMEVEELKSQLKMYEQVKADYMQKQASKDDIQEYKELMDKLTLLKEDAKSDQERLARESLENEKKAMALNKYQQMIRNIINANEVAKSKLITRNGIISDQESTIGEQKTDIKNLETEVAQKKNMIAKNEQQIEATQNALDRSKKQLLQAYHANRLTKKQYEERAHRLQEQSDEKIQALADKNQTYSTQLDQLSGQLKNTQQQLVGTQSALAGTQAQLQGTQEQLAGTQEKLAGTRAALQAKAAEAEGLRGEAGQLQQQIGNLKNSFATAQARDRAAFEAQLKKGKLDAAERARREGEFRASAARKEKEMQGKLAGLAGRLKDTEGQLAKAKEEMDARREIAKEIKAGFDKAGVKADVDMQTGEVVLDFGNAYFESDSANLKPKMKEIIERAMPVYSKSLFGNKKVADKISSVEVVGFASPTYQGRYVDPRSNKPEDKAALRYNMDLSYRRANSIFNYLLANKNNEFNHEQDLLSLMKVSGRSFLEVMKLKGRSPASAAEFCKVNDCKKAQKVIVRFSMDGKK